jgi:oligoribonuclease NrnB/cAMP/cGMP phosphodiesterase (DHH superfamily)
MLDLDLQTICLHHNDTDGRASAAIIRYALGNDIWFYEMDYGDLVPLEKIIITDNIIIATYHHLTWIDHHKSAIEELNDISEAWLGIRDTSKAACVLTWQYFFPDRPIPQAIRLIGDRDIWKWSFIDTGAFNEGLYQLDTRPMNDDLWIPLIEDDPETLEKILKNGRILREARLKTIRRTLLSRGFAVDLDGYKTFVINIHGSGDIGQQVRNMGYEIAYCYSDNYLNSELTTYVTLYSDKVDVSEIAKRFGGGGHSGAAGFHFKRDASPFPPGLKVEIKQDE